MPNPCVQERAAGGADTFKYSIEYGEDCSFRKLYRNRQYQHYEDSFI
jgi:hypothetical protein